MTVWLLIICFLISFAFICRLFLLYFCYFLAGPYSLCWLLCVRCVSFLSDSYLFSIRHLSLFPLFIACHKHQTKTFADRCLFGWSVLANNSIIPIIIICILTFRLYHTVFQRRLYHTLFQAQETQIQRINVPGNLWNFRPYFLPTRKVQDELKAALTKSQSSEAKTWVLMGCKLQGSFNYPFYADQTRQMNGNFDRFPL